MPWQTFYIDKQHQFQKCSSHDWADQLHALSDIYVQRSPRTADYETQWAENDQIPQDTTAGELWNAGNLRNKYLVLKHMQRVIYNY